MKNFVNLVIAMRTKYLFALNKMKKQEPFISFAVNARLIIKESASFIVLINVYVTVLKEVEIQITKSCRLKEEFVLI